MKKDPPEVRVWDRTRQAEAALVEQIRTGIREGFPNASEDFVERQLRWFLGDDLDGDGESRDESPSR